MSDRNKAVRTLAGIGALLLGILILAGCDSALTRAPQATATSLPPTAAPSATEAPSATSEPAAAPTETPTVVPTALPKGVIAIYPEREMQTIREVGGGNFVHWPHNTAPFEAVSEYNLNAFAPAVVRARMSLDLWEPVNDDADPNHIDETGFVDEGPNRYTFEMLRRFQQEGRTIVVSSWDVPDWMVDFPDAEEKRRIKPEFYPEAAESIAAWLTHARDQYGVETAYISFNEADIGAHVSLSSAEYADLIRAAAPVLEANGLRVKWLLGDSAGIASAVSYARAIWTNEDIRPYLGPLAFHSWDANTLDAKLIAIRDFARQEGLEVWCTEAGYAPFLWQRPEEFPTWDNALSLAAIYLRLLKNTGATTLLYWEMMAQDYPLNDGQSAYPALEVVRLLQAYFPAGAVVLDTSENSADLKWSGAWLPGGELAAVLLNRGGKPLDVTLLGLPAGEYMLEPLTADGLTGLAGSVTADGSLLLSVPAKSILFMRQK